MEETLTKRTGLFRGERPQQIPVVREALGLPPLLLLLFSSFGAPLPVVENKWSKTAALQRESRGEVIGSIASSGNNGQLAGRVAKETIWPAASKAMHCPQSAQPTLTWTAGGGGVRAECREGVGESRRAAYFTSQQKDVEVFSALGCATRLGMKAKEGPPAED